MLMTLQSNVCRARAAAAAAAECQLESALGGDRTLYNNIAQLRCTGSDRQIF